LAMCRALVVWPETSVSNSSVSLNAAGGHPRFEAEVRSIPEIRSVYLDTQAAEARSTETAYYQYALRVSLNAAPRKAGQGIAAGACACAYAGPSCANVM
jgi:hypothetical protein